MFDKKNSHSALFLIEICVLLMNDVYSCYKLRMTIPHSIQAGIWDLFNNIYCIKTKRTGARLATLKTYQRQISKPSPLKHCSVLTVFLIISLLNSSNCLKNLKYCFQFRLSTNTLVVKNIHYRIVTVRFVGYVNTMQLLKLHSLCIKKLCIWTKR